MRINTQNNKTEFIDSLFVGYANQYETISQHIVGDFSRVIINIYDKQDLEKRIAKMTVGAGIIVFDIGIHIDKVLELIKFLNYIKNEITKNPKLINFY
jgi:hypothetical protein